MDLNFGMPAGFAQALATKYGLMQMQTAAQADALAASAAKDRAATLLMPKESDANIAETKARTGNILETTKTIMPLALSRIGLEGAQTKLTGAQTKNTDEDTLTKRSLNTPLLGSFGFSL